ncbi:hypothetical protein Cabther_B0702 [Chloracidobacterium thermophilum B]|uniref:Uncharacterized protein n=1 Tax=Chloracidobacterium thermophilum (strain B) TaxID=981222 RepID=G2LL24_CHLTF|nr:hypothetical protein Cabther_B0702 [Chloracidobacterium thermophilum B]
MRTGVSLHCHTKFSREVLDFIPHYAAKIPLVAGRFARLCQRYEARHGRPLDFTQAWWTPPVTPRVLHDAEVRHMEATLGVRGIVSITDHDEIEACCGLRAMGEDVPISTEWTVPFGVAYFHVGVHNLPPDHARAIAEELFAFTKDPEARARPDVLEELFSMLNALPGVLVVLNHPLWDIENIGQAQHLAALKNFLDRYKRWLHALEINGFRSWRENLDVARLARELELPLVSGGDRHGLSPNTVVNLTDAATFEAMVEELRVARRSHVVVLPTYQENMLLRVFEAAAQILDDYPDYPEGQRHWTERLFFLDEHGQPQSLRQCWSDHSPLWARVATWVFRQLGRRHWRPALERVLPKPQFELGEL